MKVKARKNLIYDGTFRKAGEVFQMTDSDARDYENRHWVQTAKAQPQLANVPAELPPLNVDKSKKK